MIEGELVLPIACSVVFDGDVGIPAASTFAGVLTLEATGVVSGPVVLDVIRPPRIRLLEPTVWGGRVKNLIVRTRDSGTGLLGG